MTATLLGIKNLNFRADGQDVIGTQLFFSFPEDGAEGQICDKIFVREGTISLPPLTPGMALNITFNRKGKPERIDAVPAKQININK